MGKEVQPSSGCSFGLFDFVGGMRLFWQVRFALLPTCTLSAAVGRLHHSTSHVPRRNGPLRCGLISTSRLARSLTRGLERATASQPPSVGCGTNERPRLCGEPRVDVGLPWGRPRSSHASARASRSRRALARFWTPGRAVVLERRAFPRLLTRRAPRFSGLSVRASRGQSLPWTTPSWCSSSTTATTMIPRCADDTRAGAWWEGARWEGGSTPPAPGGCPARIAVASPAPAAAPAPTRGATLSVHRPPTT